MNLDDLVKISIAVLLFSITLIIIVQLGIALHSLNSILRDVKKVSSTAVENAYETRKFAIDTVVMLIEGVILNRFDLIKSGALGGLLKVLKVFKK